MKREERKKEGTNAKREQKIERVSLLEEKKESKASSDTKVKGKTNQKTRKK